MFFFAAPESSKAQVHWRRQLHGRPELMYQDVFFCRSLVLARKTASFEAEGIDQIIEIPLEQGAIWSFFVGF